MRERKEALLKFKNEKKRVLYGISGNHYIEIYIHTSKIYISTKRSSTSTTHNIQHIYTTHFVYILEGGENCFQVYFQSSRNPRMLFF